MSSGKIVVSLLVLSAVLSAAVLWYVQVYGLYDEVDEITGAQSLLVTDADGATHALPVTDFRAIDSASVPLRYRACFQVDPAALEGAKPFAVPTPLGAPGWFRCYSQRALTADLASGAARAYLSQAEIHADIDRVIAVYPDGRAFAWHQLNESAEEKKVIE